MMLIYAEETLVIYEARIRIRHWHEHADTA